MHQITEERVFFVEKFLEIKSYIAILAAFPRFYQAPPCK